MDKKALLYYFNGTGNSRSLAFIAARRFEEAGFRGREVQFEVVLSFEAANRFLVEEKKLNSKRDTVRF